MTNTHVLDFEKNIVELEAKIEGLKLLAEDEDVDISKEVKRLQIKLDRQVKNSYANLTPWQKSQVARHPERPHCLDYVYALIEDFTPLCGDRVFADDEAMIGGIGRFKGISVVVLGQEKGHDLDTRLKHNFGMAKPEGYRKAQRLMDMANKFNLPVITFVDTSGAFPGVEAEERGQAEAIASSIEKCFNIKTPIVSVVIGEGGSGGAIAIAVANRILMLEHSIYSVISPEGCASILWRSADKVKEATEALKLTAQDLKSFGVIDEIINEPLGGAHRDPQVAIQSVGDAILRHLKELLSKSGGDLKKERTEKFFAMGRNLGV
ncbi:MAG: acetyl-CoA carboxylase carboxyltransferase subunit alpha [Lactobacillus sp.]|jgi:acetyl-CoA carboxylase carboxyl transferase subunit alpha|nr:acetyl-CoA carboxylase carboxyltransferase subunit alpha [Lactobacillus sp.]